jgi:hypothetical protein
VEVPGEIIAADYALSGQYLGDDAFVTDALARAAVRGISPEEWRRDFACPPELMEALLDYIDAQYGGVHAYLRTSGLADESICALHTQLLTA